MCRPRYNLIDSSRPRPHWLHATPHRPVKSKWSAIQLCNTVSSVHSDEKRLIAVNIHEQCYFLVFLHMLIYAMCLKCSPSAHTRVLSREYHWSMDASPAANVGVALSCQSNYSGDVRHTESTRNRRRPKTASSPANINSTIERAYITDSSSGCRR